jgi:hypothetical protein
MPDFFFFFFYQYLSGILYKKDLRFSWKCARTDIRERVIKLAVSNRETVRLVLKNDLQLSAYKKKKSWTYECNSGEAFQTCENSTKNSVAPSHTANIVQRWCEDNLTDFIPKDEWPPSSPDLNPLYFSIWGYMLGQLRNYKYDTLP